MNDILKKAQKVTGLKFKNHDTDQNRLYNMGLLIIKSTEEYLDLVEKLKLTNSQMVLDFLDKLNELSVKY